VPTLKPGAAVTTSRNDVDYIVTEYGCAKLHGKTVRERMRALIDIAHPRFREDLTRQAWEIYRQSRGGVAATHTGAEGNVRGRHG